MPHRRDLPPARPVTTAAPAGPHPRGRTGGQAGASRDAVTEHAGPATHPGQVNASRPAAAVLVALCRLSDQVIYDTPPACCPPGRSARPHHPQVVTPATRTTPPRRTGARPESGAYRWRLEYRVREREQVVHLRRRSQIPVVPDQFPASRGGQATGVRFAEVVGVGFDRPRERADHRGGGGVDIRQGGDRRLPAVVTRAAP